MYTVRGVPLHRVTCDQFNFLFKYLLVSFQVKSDIVPHKRMVSSSQEDAFSHKRMSSPSQEDALSHNEDGISHNKDGISHNEDDGPTMRMMVPQIKKL